MNAHGNEFFKKCIENTKENPDIICIQETWYTDFNTLKFNNYSIISKIRENGGRGGLAIYIHNSLTFQVMDTPATEEYQRIDLFSLNKVLSIFNYYNPCKKITTKQLDDMISDCKNQFILTGDFNAHNSLWGSNKNDINGKTIEQFLDNHDLVLLNDGSPTRLDPHTGQGSCLDLTIVSSQIAHKMHWSVTNHNFGSDHFVILCTLNLQHNTPQNVSNTNEEKKWSFRNVNWNTFSEKIKEKCMFYNAPDSLKELNVQGKYNLLITIISETADETLRKVGNSKPNLNPAPWWNNEVKTAIKNRNKCKYRIGKHYRIEDLIEYKLKKAEAQRAKRKAKTQYWLKYCLSLNRTTDLGKVWNKVKNLKNNSINSHVFANLLTKDGTAVSSTLDKTNMIAKAFKSIESQKQGDSHDKRRQVFEKEIIDKLVLNENTDHPLNHQFTISELKDAVKETKNTAAGKDGIRAIMIQVFPDIAFTILLHLFNVIWNSAIFPKQWLHCIQLPILKPGKDPTSTTSYRPISLTPVICKIMERMVKNRLVWFLERNSLISTVQAGFRKKRSTMDHLLMLETDIHKGLKNKEYIAVVFLDLEKAYDLLWKKGVIYKCHALGLRDNMLKWIIAFLQDRKCVVKINDQYSDEFTLKKGIPQGSVISPVLFNIMLSDLDMFDRDAIDKTTISIYADDIAIWCSGRNLNHLQSKMQQALNHIMEWCNKWDMRISAPKSAVMVFTNKHTNNIQLTINGQVLQQYSEYKFLGVWFDEKMLWKKHISIMKEKCMKRINLLRCIAGSTWGSNGQFLLIIYRGLIRSILDYGSELYDSACPTLKAQLDSIQYKALKIITGAVFNTSLDALQVECGELPLKYRRQLIVDKYKFYLMCFKVNFHPTVNIISDSWYFKLFKWKDGTGPFFNRACTLKCDVEQFQDSILKEPFWCLTKPNISYFHTDKFNKKQDLSFQIRNLIMERIACHWKGFLKIYTDGSKQDDKSTGAAFYIPDLGIKKSFRLTSVNIMRAELVAILLTLNWLENLTGISVVVFVDSLSALNCMEKLCYNSVIVAEIVYKLNLLKLKDINVYFEWIPSHCGVPGNEVVDNLAKEGSLKNIIEVTLPHSKCELINHMKTFHYTFWQADWETSQHGRHLFQIQPDVCKTVHIRGLPRKDEVLIHQLRLGQCKLNYYLFCIKQHEDGLCNNCSVPETIEHYLINCTKYINERAILKRSLKLDSLCVDKILKHDADKFQALLKYVFNTKRFT